MPYPVGPPGRCCWADIANGKLFVRPGGVPGPLKLSGDCCEGGHPSSSWVCDPYGVNGAAGGAYGLSEDGPAGDIGPDVRPLKGCCGWFQASPDGLDGPDGPDGRSQDGWAY